MNAAPAESPRPFRRLGFALVPLLAFAVLVGLFVRALSEGPAVRHSARLGQPAPPLDLPPIKALGGSGLITADLRGKWLVVNFWASWCPPCRVEHPFLMELAGRGGFELVGVAYKDRPDKSAAFLSELGNPFAHLGADTSGRLAIEWGVSGVPETFVVAPDGTVVAHVPGPITPEIVADWPLPP